MNICFDKKGKGIERRNSFYPFQYKYSIHFRICEMYPTDRREGRIKSVNGNEYCLKKKKSSHTYSLSFLYLEFIYPFTDLVSWK